MVTANRFWSQIFGVAFSNKRWLHFFIDHRTRLFNVKPEAFPDKVFEGSSLKEIVIEKHQWSNYFVCGFKGIMEEAKFEISKATDLLVDGRMLRMTIFLRLVKKILIIFFSCVIFPIWHLQIQGTGRSSSFALCLCIWQL